MLLQTQIPLKKQPNNLIDYNSKLLLLGSCFSENIGDKLSYFKFQTNVNPFGILFHPKAIEHLIKNAVDQKVFSEKDIFFQNERWHSFKAHSSLSNSNKEALLNDLNTIINTTHQQLLKATHVIITLGTSWVYKHISSSEIVANCHKIPQREFSKELLSVDQISNSLNTIISLLKKINKNITMIFTVSPVRHLKDGFVENMQSKAHLISAIHQVLASTPTSLSYPILDKTDKQNSSSLSQQNNSYYFPSYEIMMDELRDYRFYTEDMLHPNQTAVNYIWGKFTTVWCSEKALEIMDEVATIQKGLAHKPFNPNSKKHEAFLQKLSQKTQALLKTTPNIKF